MVVLGTVTGTGYTRSTAGSSIWYPGLGILTSHSLWSEDPSLVLALGTEDLGQGRSGPG